MNTSAVTSTAHPVTSGGHKLSSQDGTASDVNFGHLLTREIAERSPQEGQKSTFPRDTQKTTGNTSAQLQESTDETQSKDVVDAGDVPATPSTEQLLLMAAQFSSSGDPVQPVTPSQIANNPIAPVTVAQADTSLITDPAVDAAKIASGSSSEVAQSIAENSVVKSAELTHKTPSDFDSTLEQALDNRQSPDTLSDSEKLGKMNAPYAQGSNVASSADMASIAAASKTALETAAEKIQDARSDLSAALAPLQQVTTNHAQSTVSADRIAPQIGTSAWNQAISQKVIWMLGNEQQSASLTLNPPDLGPLQVVLSVSSTQANASFYSAQPEVRHALEAALPKLREMLSDAGIQLGQANVNAGSSQQQGTFADFQPSTRVVTQAGNVAISPSPVNINSPQIIREGLIDTFA